MRRFKKMMTVAVLVAIGSQFSLHLFVEGFIITLSVILLAFCLYIYSGINPIWTCFLTAGISPGFRFIIEYSKTPSWAMLLKQIGPDVVFYFAYGLLFYALFWAQENKHLSRFVLTIFLCDFGSNMIEMWTRTNFEGVEGSIIRALVLIAALRSFCVVLLIIAHRQYRSFLVNQEHENRYRKLLMLTAGFKSEIYFMHKNMQTIEEVMSKSFQVHKMAKEEGGSSELCELTLDVSKDIHEIKKDYVRVIKGLEFISKGKLDHIKSIHIKDLVDILVQNTKEYLETEGYAIELHTQVTADLKIKHHFYLMSVLRNIVNNSIEATQNQKNGKINMMISEDEQNLKIKCYDNGKGIAEDDLAFIFNPGFSTKYDLNSGDANRGLGLTMVKDIVEEFFQGQLEVTSDSGGGTSFTLLIPSVHLKGD